MIFVDMSRRKLDAVLWEIVVMMYCWTNVRTALTAYSATRIRHIETTPSRSIGP